MLIIINYLFLLKNIISSLIIYLISLIYLGGILLLLFYVSIIYSRSFKYPDLLRLILFVIPLYKIYYIKFSFLSVNNNLNNINILILIIRIITFVVVLLGYFIIKLNFIRQIK